MMNNKSAFLGAAAVAVGGGLSFLVLRQARHIRVLRYCYIALTDWCSTTLNDVKEDPLAGADYPEEGHVAVSVDDARREFQKISAAHARILAAAGVPKLEAKDFDFVSHSA